MKDARRSQTATAVTCVFHEGDQVYLAKGSYQGTVGTFIRLRTDPKWADILEPDLTVRVHPVKKMRLLDPPPCKSAACCGVG